MNTKPLIATPIGRIISEKGRFSIEIKEAYRDALLELDGFSHLHIFWWGHLCDTEECRAITIAEKAYKKGPEKIGIFATRSPARPTPVLVTVVPVLSIDKDKGMIAIPFIDAENDTPVIDIKGYYAFDRIRKVSVPEWCAHWPEWYEDSATFDWEAEFENAHAT